MKRIVGLPSRNPKVPPLGINDVLKSTDSKASDYDAKVEQCDSELRKISQQLRTMRPGPSRQGLQEKAKLILNRKKRYEQQAEQMKEKSFNMDSLATSIQSAQDAKIIASTLKSSTKQLKKELKKVNLDEIEDVQDDLQDLIELTEEVETSLGKSYTVPEDIDDDELNNQLEMLGDEIVADNDPSYLDEALQQPKPGILPPSQAKTTDGQQVVPRNVMGLEVDDYGLPISNMNSANTAQPEKTSQAENENKNHPV